MATNLKKALVAGTAAVAFATAAQAGDNLLTSPGAYGKLSPAFSKAVAAATGDNDARGDAGAILSVMLDTMSKPAAERKDVERISFPTKKSTKIYVFYGAIPGEFLAKTTPATLCLQKDNMKWAWEVMTAGPNVGQFKQVPTLDNPEGTNPNAPICQQTIATAYRSMVQALGQNQPGAPEAIATNAPIADPATLLAQARLAQQAAAPK